MGRRCASVLEKKPEASTLEKPGKKLLSPTQKGETLRQYFMKHPSIEKSSEEQRKCKKELQKAAHHTLVVLLKPIVSNYLEKKKFRHMCLEEMPWRSQMNIYLAVAHYSLFKKNLEEQCNIGIFGSQHLDSYNILDPEIFSLNNCGTIVVREAVENSIPPTPSVIIESGMTKEQTGKDKSFKPSIKISGTNTPQTQTTDTETSVSCSPRECNQFLPNTILLEHFAKIFLHLKKAVVLAHRGGHWTLLQNACRELWNYTQELQFIANCLHSQMDTFPVTRDFLRNTIWFPFYLASDMIIDMITELQASASLKIVDPEGDFCIPSCLGGIMDENGGSGLHPQSPLDDVNVVDLKWICNLILKTIELLYKMKKWEALVHIAVQFNVLTHERYTEQVSPLLVYAQRQLLERIQQSSGLDSHEPNFIKYLSNNADKINCRNYIGQKIQLPVASSASEQIFPGCFFYPEMKNDYAVSTAKALVSVPLDVNDTLKCFRESLQKANCHSRALRHSRKLLSLFLAYTQEKPGRTISSQISSRKRLEVDAGAEVMYLPTPYDLSQEKFRFSSRIESKPIPHTHLSLIITSYEQTIGILEINKQRDLKVQALHELGNLHFYVGNKRAAFKYWCQALDETLNIPDALSNWQELCFPKNATDCFTVGRLTDISQKFLSQAGIWGCLHAAVLVAKIAQYIATSKISLRTKYCYFSAILFKTLFRASLPHPTSDCDFAQYETNMLIPGIDLFSDRYRGDISTVVASLNFLMFELHCAKQNLIILPLFTLYQYIVSEICKDPVKSIEGRIFKIKVLTDIGFFTEAFHELSLLNCGERIPWKIPAGYRIIEQIMASQQFDSSESLLTVTNLQVLEDIFNRNLSLTMVPLCNQNIMNKLTLVKMHLIICLSATINNIPEKVEKHIYFADTGKLKEPSTITGPKGNAGKNADKNSRPQEQNGTMMQLVHSKDKLNMAMLKGILLTEAKENLSHLVQNIQDKYDGEISQCSAEDLEVLLEAKLELAAIFQQWHQAPFSAALAFSAIRLLQDAEIFRMEETHFKEENDENQCLDSYIKDIRLPHNVTAQDHINVHLWLRCRTTLVTALVAQIHGIGDMEENYVAERRSVLKEVILESEAFGDTETQAEMMVQAAILDLQEKRPVADVKLLVEIFVCGEPIEQQIDDSTLTCLVLPTKNIYLPHMNLLAQVKMRIGHTLAEKVACTPARGDPLQWLGALKHLESALKLCRASATERIDLEAELLFWIGKVELQIAEASNSKSSQAAETLMEAIKLSQQHDQKFELIRRSYLEIALSYLHFATNNEDVSHTDKMVPSKSNIASGELSSPKEFPKSEGCKVQAWIAVRAATQVSEAVLDSKLLVGMKSIKEHSMKDAVRQKIPEFASMDLLASYRDFLSDGYNVISESPKVFYTETEQIIEDKQSQSKGTESLATKARQKKQTITWIHLIRYHNYLKRLYNTNLFAAPDSGPGSFSARDGHLSSVFDTGIVLRIAEMHSFLKKHLVHYSVCCLENFPEELCDVELPLDRPADSSKVSPGISSPVSVVTEAERQMESRAANAPNKEINIQWYIPSLAKPSNDTEAKVLLLYAYNTKPVKISDIKNFSSVSIFSGHLWIPLSRIICLRRELSNLKQQVEVLIQSSKSLSSASEPTCFHEQRKTLEITPSKPPEMNFAKVHLDEKTEEMAKKCLSEVKALLSIVPALSLPVTEIPFDITLQSIASLEAMFDPASGCRITEESLFNWIVSLFH
uniref:Uncharacterized protein n=1 Tax=Melopsittacus undulatus TaxID=13146 RepID=A0A8C6J0C5_MELUD